MEFAQLEMTRTLQMLPHMWAVRIRLKDKYKLFGILDRSFRVTCAFGLASSWAKDLRSELEGSLDAKGEAPDDDVDEESSSELLSTWIGSRFDSTFDIVVK